MLRDDKFTGGGGTYRCCVMISLLAGGIQMLRDDKFTGGGAYRCCVMISLLAGGHTDAA